MTDLNETEFVLLPNNSDTTPLPVSRGIKRLQTENKTKEADNKFYIIFLDDELYGYCTNIKKIKNMMLQYFESEKDLTNYNYHYVTNEKGIALYGTLKNSAVVHDVLVHKVIFKEAKFIG